MERIFKAYIVPLQTEVTVGILEDGKRFLFYNNDYLKVESGVEWLMILKNRKSVIFDNCGNQINFNEFLAIIEDSYNDKNREKREKYINFDGYEFIG